MDMLASEPLSFQYHPNVKRIELGIFRIHTKGRLQLVGTGDIDDIGTHIWNDTIEDQKYVVLPVIVAGDGD